MPDIGDFEDVEVVEILAWYEVEFDDPLSVESDKATMEIPSTAAGVVADRVAEGDRVSEEVSSCWRAAERGGRHPGRHACGRSAEATAADERQCIRR